MASLTTIPINSRFTTTFSYNRVLFDHTKITGKDPQNSHPPYVHHYRSITYFHLWTLTIVTSISSIAIDVTHSIKSDLRSPAKNSTCISSAAIDVTRSSLLTNNSSSEPQLTQMLGTATEISLSNRIWLWLVGFIPLLYLHLNKAEINS